MNTAEKIRLPDDCTIGYIIESVLGVRLTRSNLFHSHLENLQQVTRSEIPKQVITSASIHFQTGSKSDPHFFNSTRLSSRLPSVMGCLKTKVTSSVWKGLFLWRTIHRGQRFSWFLQADNTVFHVPDLCVCVFQVQVCALSPVPRHSLVSPPGCLLGRPLLPHPRPCRASVSERHAGTSVLYWTEWLLRSSCSGVRSLLVLLGCCAARLGTFPSCLKPKRRPVILGRKILAFWGGSCFQRWAFASNQLNFVMYMLLVNVPAILIECINIYSRFFASFTLTLAFKNAKPLRFCSFIYLHLAFLTPRTPDKCSNMKTLLHFKWTVFLSLPELAYGQFPNAFFGVLLWSLPWQSTFFSFLNLLRWNKAVYIF